MEMLELYNIANNHKINIENFPMNGIKSFSYPGTVVIDAEKITTSIEEKLCVAHEMGHCQTGSFYNIYSNCDTKSRQEYRANKWAVHKMIPLKDYIHAIKSGYTEVWDLAEYFDVTEDFIKLTHDIYTREGKLIF